MNAIPVAERKRTSYENFAAECPWCRRENIFNRASDLKTFEPIAGRDVSCLSAAEAPEFIARAIWLRFTPIRFNSRSSAASAAVTRTPSVRSRQLKFTFQSRTFKVKYDHSIGGRGGIQIVEVLSRRGSPEGDGVIEIKSLSEAEKFYNDAEEMLRQFLRQAQNQP